MHEIFEVVVFSAHFKQSDSWFHTVEPATDNDDECVLTDH